VAGNPRDHKPCPRQWHAHQNPDPGNIDKRGKIQHSARLSEFPNSQETVLANTVQAKKRARQAEDHRQHNTALRSMLRTHIKKVLKAVEKKDKDAAQAAFKEAVSVIDKVANKGIIHKNNAARQKSRLNSRLRALA
jgi:small subunit ribosomal protein S20